MYVVFVTRKFFIYFVYNVKTVSKNQHWGQNWFTNVNSTSDCGALLTSEVSLDACVSHTVIFYCFLTQSGHPVLKWAVFNFAVFHSKVVTLLFSSNYILSEVSVVNHGSFQIQRIWNNKNCPL